MSELDAFFTDIREEIAKDVNKKSLLQELENQFDLSLIPYQTTINSWTSVSPNQLNKVFQTTNSFEDAIRENIAKFTNSLSELDCKSSQKERLSNKFTEDSIYILLVNRYFWILAAAFVHDPIKVKLITTQNELGIIATPSEIFQSLGIQDVNYQLYLIALLRLIEIVVEYTTTTVINQSIGSTSSQSSNYSIGLINSKIVSKIQNGFSLLDLKNDILRKKYDSLKYNSQRLNKIVYDLSLRNLVTTEAEVE
ncbi:tsn1 [Candida margitis]|uniref:tsn1 n=1 Tax=Candida margitis TaxID=1775924 RepID=UPI002227DA41|nr:tsn1 [Candida margitis]KAI5969069.1 tsn1 [Candida margitis]